MVVIEMTRTIVMGVVDAWREPRTRVVDRRCRVIRGRDAVVDSSRRVHGRWGGIVPVFIIRRRARGDACSGNCANRAAYGGTVTAMNVVADRSTDACADNGAQQRVIVGIRRA